MKKPLFLLLTFAFSPLATLSAAEPVLYIEAETGEGGGQPHAMAGTSGGKFLRHIGPKFRRSLPLEVTAPLSSGRFYIRYGRSGKATDLPAELQVGIGPATAQRLEEAAVVKLEPLVLKPTGSWETWGWASSPLPPLAAGSYKIFLHFPGELANLDVMGLLPVRNGVQVEPSNTVSGKVLVGGLTVKNFASNQLGNLFAGADYLGKPEAKAHFELELENGRQMEPITATVTWEVYHEAGIIEKLGPTTMEIPPKTIESLPVKFKLPGYGWYGVRAMVHSSYDDQILTKDAAFGVIHPAHVGVRPESQFGLCTGSTAEDAAVAALIGAKWRRGVPNTHPNWVNSAPGVFWDETRVKTALDAIALWKKAGILCLGYVDYNTQWNVRKDKNGKPMPNWASPPQDLQAHAEMVYQMIKPLREEVRVWELWNEPWGHYWQGGTADEFREMTRLVWERVKPEMPEIEFISGSYYTNHLHNILYPKGTENAGYIDGSATHPYGKPGLQTMISPAIEAEMNKRWSKGKGKAGIWVTEFGTAEWEFSAHPAEERPFMVARSVAPIVLLQQAAAGNTPVKTFWFTNTYGKKTGANDGFEIWNYHSPKPAVVAFSVMTHFLEDSRFVADLWIGSKNGFALLYERPDQSRVVAVWPDRVGFLGSEKSVGSLKLSALDFEATDYLGQPVGSKENGMLILPARTWQTTFLVSKKSEPEIREALAAATLQGWPALRVNPQPFTLPLARKPPLIVRVENRLAHPTDATIQVEAPPGFTLAQDRQTVLGLKSGEVRDITFGLTATKSDPTNRYPFRWKSEATGMQQEGTREVQVAVVAYGTPKIDGDLADWTESVPVSIRHKGPMADWGKEAPPMLTGDGYRFQARWDEENFYVAAEIPDAQPKSIGGSKGDITNSDSLQFAFHVLEQNPDNLLREHPFYEKALATDVDYEFALGQLKPDTAKPVQTAANVPVALRGDGGFTGDETSAEASADLIPSLYRLTAPGTQYQHPSAYLLQNPLITPTLGRLEAERKVAIRFDDAAKKFIYEAAIPWALIPEVRQKLSALQPGEMAPIHFAFMVNDFEKWRRITTWQEETGETVLGGYGFAPRIGTPRWPNDYPLQVRTAWGFVR